MHIYYVDHVAMVLRLNSTEDLAVSHQEIYLVETVANYGARIIRWS